MDIFIKIDIDDYKWLLVIENKIHSEEGEKQTEFYTKELSDKYSDKIYKKICIFLTPEGRKPSSDYFMAMSWMEIYEILDLIRSKNMKRDLSIFLDHLKYSIKGYFMNENEDRINEILEKLFSKHFEVLEFIYQKYPKYVKDFNTEVLNIFESRFKEEYGNEWEFFTGSNWIRLQKKGWIKIQEKYNKLVNTTQTQYFGLFDFILSIDRNRLYLLFSSHPHSPEHLRKEFKQKLIRKAKNNNFDFTDNINDNLRM